MNSYDAIIIGGGPGGVKAALTFAKNGKKTALVASELGGECLNYGCIPTKVCLHAAELAEKISQAETFGIDLGNVGAIGINWERLKKRKNEVVAKLQRGLRFILEKEKVQILAGTGKLKNKNMVEVTTKDGTSEIRGEFIVIATGSQPVIPAGLKLSEKIITNRELLEISAVPKTLLIIGGGVTGVEFASLFAALGCKVAIAEMGDRLLAHADAEISAELEKIFTKKSIEILKNATVNEELLSKYEKVLISTGRKPAVDGLGLKEAGVTFTQHGASTNEFMQTNVPNIFAIGDLAGKSMLAYTADREGEIAAGASLNQNPVPINYNSIPYTVFTIPEIAWAGITEKQAVKQNLQYVTGKAAFSANSKALITGGRDGFAKIIIEKNTGKLLGIHIIGEKASELIGQASLAITLNLTLKDFYQNIQSHPVLSEIFQEAIGNANPTLY